MANPANALIATELLPSQLWGQIGDIIADVCKCQECWDHNSDCTRRGPVTAEERREIEARVAVLLSCAEVV